MFSLDIHVYFDLPKSPPNIETHGVQPKESCQKPEVHRHS